jgi:hypothetical protein
MDNMVALLEGFVAWFLAQPAALQVAVVVVILAGLYPVLLVARVLVAALYGAFRGLG